MLLLLSAVVLLHSTQKYILLSSLPGKIRNNIFCEYKLKNLTCDLSIKLNMWLKFHLEYDRIQFELTTY